MVNHFRLTDRPTRCHSQPMINHKTTTTSFLVSLTRMMMFPSIIGLILLTQWVPTVSPFIVQLTPPSSLVRPRSFTGSILISSEPSLFSSFSVNGSGSDAESATAATTASTSDTTDGTTTWYDATVLMAQPACPSGKSLLWTVQVDGIPESVSPSIPPFEYTDPGQFVQLRCSDDNADIENCDESNNELILAMCGPPEFNEPNKLEFLVKTTPNIPWLTDIKPGSKVQVTQCQGRGLASSIAKVLEEALAKSAGGIAAAATTTTSTTDDNVGDDATEEDDGQVVENDGSIDHLLLVAAGSGIAPLMACLREGGGWLPNAVQYVSMYYGEWTMDDLCFQEYLFPSDIDGADGANHKIYTVPCLSRQKRDLVKNIWSGHVQNVMWSRGVVNPEKTLAVVCGMDEMEHDVKQLLKRAGVDESRILTNR